MTDLSMIKAYEFYFGLPWGESDFEQAHWKASWKASREAVAVDLPPVPQVPEDPEEAIDDSHMDAYHAAVRMRSACAKSIKAAGLKVGS